MILYGGRLSPFVRLVELWLALQDRPVERHYVSVFDSEFGGVLEINPLGRVPVLTTDDGEHLFETLAILDYLENTALPDRRLIPLSGAARWQTMQILALCHGISEKGVALHYETRRRPPQYQWDEWRLRLSSQIRNGLAALDKAIVDSGRDVIGAVEAAACCAYDINVVTQPALLPSGLNRLEALSKRANEQVAFARTYPTMQSGR
jgi:glutathione S-transferase